MISISDEQLNGLSQHLKVSQIIIGALAAGSLLFAVIATISVPREKIHWDVSMDNLVGAIGVVFAVGAILAWIVLPFFIHKSVVISGDSPTEKDVLQAHTQVLTESIIRSAVVEGAAFFCLIAWMIEGSIPALIAALICIAFIVALIPARNRHASRMENHLSRS